MMNHSVLHFRRHYTNWLWVTKIYLIMVLWILRIYNINICMLPEVFLQLFSYTNCGWWRVHIFIKYSIFIKIPQLKCCFDMRYRSMSRLYKSIVSRTVEKIMYMVFYWKNVPFMIYSIFDILLAHVVTEIHS